MDPRDTHPRVIELLTAGYRAMPGAQKIARAFDMSRAVRELAAARIRREHPELDAREVQVRVAALCYGQDVVDRALGHARAQPADTSS